MIKRPKPLKLALRLKLLLMLGLIGYSLESQAQTDTQEKASPAAILVGVHYGAQLPAGDMAERFGFNFDASGEVAFLTSNNWLLGAEGHFLFGNTVNEDVLAGMRTAEGFVLAQNAAYADARLDQRGIYVGVYGGKWWLWGEHAKFKHGLCLQVGGGVLQHRIYIRDVDENTFQLSGDYRKGYDRLTNGFALHEWIGYRYMSRNQRINFSIGFDLMQGFTQNRRDWDFVAMQALDNPRLDLLNGLRVGWTLPLYIYGKEQSEDFFYGFR